MNPALSSKERSDIRKGWAKRPILYCAISFCAGIYLASLFNIPVVYSSILCLILVLLAAVFVKKNIPSHLFLYFALLLFGSAYYQNSLTLPADHIANFATEIDNKIYLRGIVVDDPVLKKISNNRNRTSFILNAKWLKRESLEQNISGLVKVDIYTDEAPMAPQTGDELILYGNLSAPEGLKNPGLFDYSQYLKIRHIYAIMSVSGNNSVKVMRNGPANSLIRRAFFVRRAINEAITRYIDTPYSGFIKAILTGERSELGSSVTDDFVKTGTVHVIAISGLNIALVAGIFFMVFKMFGIKKRFNLIITSAAIVFYCFVAGSSPPVVRATVIFIISSLGYIINRESDILNSMSGAAFLILLVNPLELFDPSFQLSFGSVISIVLFAPRIEKIFSRERTNYFTKSISVSAAASLGVFPIVAKYFNIVSPISIIANLIIVPALLVITVVSFVFLPLYFIGAYFCLPPLGVLLSFLTWLSFNVNHVLAGIPASYIRIPAPSAILILIYYTALSLIMFTRRKDALLVPILLVITVMVWIGNFDPSSRLLRITFIDVGKGDSILIQFPGKGTMLIDGGSGGIEGTVDMGKAVVGPFLWNHGVRKLDAVAVTHLHEDHLGGLIYVLNNFNVGCVIDNGAYLVGDRTLYDKYRGIIKRRKIRRIILNEPDGLTGFGAVKVLALNPPKSEEIEDSNDNSIVLKIIYRNFSALMCADVTSKNMRHMIENSEILKSDIIKIPHHGGSLGQGRDVELFLNLVDAKASIISVNRRYRFLKSSKDTRKIIEASGSVNYETNICGAIRVISDGTRFKVEEFCHK